MSSNFSTSYKAYRDTSHAALYSKYRPTYPDSLIKLLLDYLHKSGGSQDLVVDVGCGSGQCTFRLQEHFKQCLGIDISSAQIKEAEDKALTMNNEENVRFLVGDASELPVESGTVDLVTAATSWHYFTDKSKFFIECKRVLKSNGCVAVFGYAPPRFPSSPSSVAIGKLVNAFIFDTLKNYTDEVVQLPWNEYRDVSLPFDNVERHDLVLSSRSTVADFTGLLSSVSSYQKYCTVYPGNSVLQELEQNIMTELTGGGSNHSSHEIEIDLEFPLFALLGKNDQ